MIRRFASLAAAAAFLLFFLSACATSYAPTPFWNIRNAAFKELKAGITTKEDVRRQIGVPLAESHFPGRTRMFWEYRYLEGSTMRMLAYVHFDANGIYKGTAQRLDLRLNGADCAESRRELSNSLRRQPSARRTVTEAVHPIDSLARCASRLSRVFITHRLRIWR